MKTWFSKLFCVSSIIFSLSSMSTALAQNSLDAFGLQQGGETVFFVIRDYSSSAQEYVFWLEAGGVPFCESLYRSNPGRTAGHAIGCERMFRSIPPGQPYTLYYSLVDDNPDRAEAAGSRRVSRL